MQALKVIGMDMSLVILSPMAVDDGGVQGERTTEVTRSTVIYHTASPVASAEDRTLS